MLEHEDGTPRFVRLARVGDMTAARVLAARLQAEGIEVRVHGQAMGPYPMTVGQMAETELWVLSDRIEEASRILLDAEVNDALASANQPEESEPVRPPMPFEMQVVAIVVGMILAILVVFAIARVY